VFVDGLSQKLYRLAARKVLVVLPFFQGDGLLRPRLLLGHKQWRFNTRKIGTFLPATLHSTLASIARLSASPVTVVMPSNSHRLGQ
jgi:hypothetical protein